jgi:hypothetical protein
MVLPVTAGIVLVVCAVTETGTGMIRAAAVEVLLGEATDVTHDGEDVIEAESDFDGVFEGRIDFGADDILDEVCELVFHPDRELEALAGCRVDFTDGDSGARVPMEPASERDA